jgi:diguanylate cyclase (GGDEF)-like protein
MQTKLHILLISDNEATAVNFQDYCTRIDHLNVEITHVVEFERSHLVLEMDLIDLVIIDLSHSGESGFSNFLELTHIYPQLPTVILTEIGEVDLSLSAIKAGAQDYLFTHQLDEHTILKASLFAIERKNKELELAYLANHDPLTGLPNRRLFSNRLKRGMKRFHRKTDHLSLGILVLDLDNFKSVNDAYGHQIGDKVLETIAKRLLHRLRHNDTVARIGGDEFVIILEGIMEESIGVLVANNILETISRPIIIDDISIIVTGSIGISYYPNHGDDVDVLLEKADQAMYQAKKSKEKIYPHQEL